MRNMRMGKRITTKVNEGRITSIGMTRADGETPMVAMHINMGDGLNTLSVNITPEMLDEIVETHNKMKDSFK